MAKVSYKKIKTNINWNRQIVDSYYQLSAADFIPEDELDQSHVLGVLLRGRAKRLAVIQVEDLGAGS